MTRSSPLSLFALAAMACTSALPAMARHQIGAVGGSGDAQAVAVCPAGQELRGFRGRSGVWLDQVQILCAARGANGVYGEPLPPNTPDGRKFGGNGGADQEEYCPATNRLDAFVVTFTKDNRRVERIDLGCSEGKGGPVRYIGRPYSSEPIGFFTRCDDEVLTGIVVNYGKDVNGLGWVCDKVKAALPEKPVKTTGKAKPGAPPPPGPPSAPVAPRQAVAGLWQTRTDAGTHYQITIQPITQGIGPNGMELPLQVFGNIVNDDGNRQLDGGLQGVIQPNSRTLMFNYSLKNGDGGGGTFTLSQDGRTLTGEATNKAKQHFVWNGTRAP